VEANRGRHHDLVCWPSPSLTGCCFAKASMPAYIPNDDWLPPRHAQAEETMQRLRKMQTVTTILTLLAGIVLVVISAVPPPPLTATADDTWADYPRPVINGRGQ